MFIRERRFENYGTLLAQWLGQYRQNVKNYVFAGWIDSFFIVYQGIAIKAQAEDFWL